MLRVRVSQLHVFLCIAHTKCLWRPEKGVGTSGTHVGARPEPRSSALTASALKHGVGPPALCGFLR